MARSRKPLKGMNGGLRFWIVPARPVMAKFLNRTDQKGQTRIEGWNDKINWPLCSRLSTRDIRAHLEEV